MVGSVDVKFPIRLEALVLKHYQFCRLEEIENICKYILLILVMNLNYFLV
jgi:hypothetical protein